MLLTSCFLNPITNLVVLLLLSNVPLSTLSPHAILLFFPCVCLELCFQANELEEMQNQLRSELSAAEVLYREQLEMKSASTIRVEEELKTK